MTQISLRAANALQLSINDVLKNIKFHAAINLDEFSRPEELIPSTLATFNANLARREKILNALYEIRNAVSVLNVNSGISSILADVARIEKDIQFYSTYTESATAEEYAIVNQRLQKLRTSEPGTVSYRQQFVTASVLTEDMVNQVRNSVASLKKQKQKLQDRLLELNVSTKLTLSSGTVATLTDENLI